MKRPEKNFWIYVALLSSILLLGLSGQLVSCASAHPGPAASAEPQHVWTAPWNQGGPSVQSQPGASLKAQLDRGAILQNGDGIVRVEVTVDSPSGGQSDEGRASDIVVVVDTSGSMEGEKLLIAQQALRALFERLAPEDRFGLVEYSDYARVLVPLQHATASAKGNFYRMTRISSVRGEAPTSATDSTTESTCSPLSVLRTVPGACCSCPMAWRMRVTPLSQVSQLALVQPQ